MKNKVQLIGNLGKNPEVKEFAKGKKVAKFSLATSESYKNAQGERVQETQWHNLVAWNNTAVYAEKYLKQGYEIAVEGKIVNRSYVDKDGQKRYTSEIVVNEILILKKKENE